MIPSNATSSGRQPTVLLVEDDELVRDAMTCALVRQGYFVHSAATAHDAIELLRTPLSPIDVVLLDVILPDVNGIDLCARLRETHPDLPVLVCSGQAGPEAIEALAKLGVLHYFLKPVPMDQLLAAVEEALP